MFGNNYCFAYNPVNSMRYSWMSQQTWWAWHSSWYMFVTFMSGHLRKTSSSVNQDNRRGFYKVLDNTNNWINYPFHALPTVHLPISEQESLIEIATSGCVKIEFIQKPLPDFLPWQIALLIKTLMPFATTYLCESGFSALTSMKTKYRHIQTVCGK